MASGGGTLSGRAVMTASDLASKRVDGIGSMRLGHAVLLCFEVIETYNKRLDQAAASRLQVRRGVVRSGFERH